MTTEVATVLAPPTREIHPLVAKETTDFKDWADWLKTWDANSNLEILLGLLHCGFKIVVKNGEEYAERALFYLRLADNHLYGYLFKKDCHEEARKQKQREALAQKAFKVLCLDFLQETSDDRIPPWLHLTYVDTRFLPAVLHFFRPGNVSGLHNVRVKDKDNRQMVIATEFISTLCTIGLGLWPENVVWRDGYQQKDLKSIQDAMKPHLRTCIELLNAMNQTHLLLHPLVWETEKCLEILESIVMKTALDLPRVATEDSRERHPASIAEAVYAKSRLAEIALILRTRQQEQQRFKEASELRQVIATADQNIKQLRQGSTQ